MAADDAYTHHHSDDVRLLDVGAEFPQDVVFSTGLDEGGEAVEAGPSGRRAAAGRRRLLSYGSDVTLTPGLVAVGQREKRTAGAGAASANATRRGRRGHLAAGGVIEVAVPVVVVRL